MSSALPLASVAKVDVALGATVAATIFFQYFLFHVIFSCLSEIVPYFRNYSFQKFGFWYIFIFLFLYLN